MDLNEDGAIDILSGSYSRYDESMAGLFQVLWGKPDGTFRKAEVLQGTDGAPLILPGTGQEDDDIDRICTRPFACDLDGDGKLDLVVGNFRGTFAWIRGEGKGRFAPQVKWLEAGGEPMHVAFHSDPFLIDWDRDGDLDLLSGSGQGGAWLFRNEGSGTAPRFAAAVELMAPAGHAEPDAEVKFGDGHLTSPSSSTRVWAADVDGDGKLDLLVGDQVGLVHAAPGVDEASARTKFAAWSKRQKELFQSYPASAEGEVDAAKMETWQKSYEALGKEKLEFARDDATGFVWLLRQR